MISEQALKEFKAIWKKQFGKEIGDELAIAEAINLLNIFNLIYKPAKKEWLKQNDYGL